MSGPTSPSASPSSSLPPRDGRGEESGKSCNDVPLFFFFQYNYYFFLM